MGAVYATVADLEDYWRELDAEDKAKAENKLRFASVMLRTMKPDLDDRLVGGDVDPDVPLMIVCAMVKRSMNTLAEMPDGLSSVQNQAGPFGQTMNFSNPDGNLFLLKAEKRLLGVSSGAVFGVDLTEDQW